MVLDTHAGIGQYDLNSGPAERTGEWHSGIGRLMGRGDPALADYLGLVEQVGLYPGSPALVRAVLREQDRMVCCELHPDDAGVLRRLFRGDRQVAVHQRDAWEAIGAFLPPAERRGIVLIDPPYEALDEFARVEAGLKLAHRRFEQGVLAAWYPVKARAQVRGLHDAMKASGIRDMVAVEMYVREPLDAARLNGCGLVVVNPPFGFEPAMRPLRGSAATSSLCLAPPRSALSSAYSVRSFLLMGTSRQPVAGASRSTPITRVEVSRSSRRMMRAS